MIEETKPISSALVEADLKAKEDFPIGTDVTVKKTNEWGVVRGYVEELTWTPNETSLRC